MKVDLNAKEFDMILSGLELFILKIRDFQLQNNIDRSYDLKCFLHLHDKIYFYSRKHDESVSYEQAIEDFLKDVNEND